MRRYKDTKKTWKDLLKHDNLCPKFIEYVKKVLNETYNTKVSSKS